MIINVTNFNSRYFSFSLKKKTLELWSFTSFLKVLSRKKKEKEKWFSTGFTENKTKYFFFLFFFFVHWPDHLMLLKIWHKLSSGDIRL